MWSIRRNEINEANGLTGKRTSLVVALVMVTMIAVMFFFNAPQMLASAGGLRNDFGDGIQNVGTRGMKELNFLS